MRIRSTLIAILAAGSLLAACHRHDEQPPANEAVVAPTPTITAPAVKPVAKPAPKIARARVKAAPEPTADQQIIDDADATGMTSHTSHDDDSGDASAPAANNSQR